MHVASVGRRGDVVAHAGAGDVVQVEFGLVAVGQMVAVREAPVAEARVASRCSLDTSAAAARRIVEEQAQCRVPALGQEVTSEGSGQRVAEKAVVEVKTVAASAEPAAAPVEAVEDPGFEAGGIPFRSADSACRTEAAARPAPNPSPAPACSVGCAWLEVEQVGRARVPADEQEQVGAGERSWACILQLAGVAFHLRPFDCLLRPRAIHRHRPRQLAPSVCSCPRSELVRG